MDTPIIAITTGEPAGIGPEISIRGAVDCLKSITPVLIGDATLLSDLASNLGYGHLVRKLDAAHVTRSKIDSLCGNLIIVDTPLAKLAAAGELNPENAPYVLKTLDIAIDGTLAKTFDAVTTAPVQKSVINDAGIPFTGHTEYFADRTHTNRVVMMLAGHIKDNPNMAPDAMLRVALATTHLPLKDISYAITVESLIEIATIIHQDLKTRFALSNPKILMAGLNPHAGENGYLGTEEIETLNPAIKALNAQGIDITGPYPADTLFQPHFLKDADCVLSMYHDQGLPVLKYATFGQGVNITLGMPIIRTSVDHGTALDIAVKGLGIAHAGSMTVALTTAAKMAANAKRTS